MSRTFRVLVTGSRTWRRPEQIHRQLDLAHESMLHDFDENAEFVVVHGGAGRGADRDAGAYAGECRWTVERHPADWARYSQRAGMVRNAAMVALGANLCLAFIRDHSPGATHCAGLTERQGIPTRRFFDCSCHPAGEDQDTPEPLKISDPPTFTDQPVPGRPGVVRPVLNKPIYVDPETGSVSWDQDTPEGRPRSMLRRVDFDCSEDTPEGRDEQ